LLLPGCKFSYRNKNERLLVTGAHVRPIEERIHAELKGYSLTYLLTYLLT